MAANVKYLLDMNTKTCTRTHTHTQVLSLSTISTTLLGTNMRSSNTCRGWHEIPFKHDIPTEWKSIGVSTTQLQRQSTASSCACHLCVFVYIDGYTSGFKITCSLLVQSLTHRAFPSPLTRYVVVPMLSLCFSIYLSRKAF